LASFRPFLTFHSKLAVRIVFGQWAESTKPRVLSKGKQPPKNQPKMQTDALYPIAGALRWSWAKLFQL
jgi:hypothetical protein